MKYPGVILRRGSEGEPVKAVQRALGVQETGLFGPTTQACVEAFQRAQRLVPDGEVGPKTWARLFGPKAAAVPVGSRIGYAALQEAVGKIGVREQPLGSNRGPEIDEWNRRAGVPVGSFWCMAFVYSMVDDASRKAGIPNPMLRTASCSALYRWARKQGKLAASPAPGDIFLCIGGERGHYHTGFVREVLTGQERFSTVEGNSNAGGSANGIEVASRPQGRKFSSCHYVRL